MLAVLLICVCVVGWVVGESFFGFVFAGLVSVISMLELSPIPKRM